MRRKSLYAKLNADEYKKLCRLSFYHKCKFSVSKLINTGYTICVDVQAWIKQESEKTNSKTTIHKNPSLFDYKTEFPLFICSTIAFTSRDLQ